MLTIEIQSGSRERKAGTSDFGLGVVVISGGWRFRGEEPGQELQQNHKL